VVWRQADKILLEEGIKVAAAATAAAATATEAPAAVAEALEIDRAAVAREAAAAAGSSSYSEAEETDDEDEEPAEILGDLEEISDEGVDLVTAAVEGAVRVLEQGVAFLAAPEKGQKTGELLIDWLVGWLIDWLVGWLVGLEFLLVGVGWFGELWVVLSGGLYPPNTQPKKQPIHQYTNTNQNQHQHQHTQPTPNQHPMTPPKASTPTSATTAHSSPP